METPDGIGETNSISKRDYSVWVGSLASYLVINHMSLRLCMDSITVILSSFFHLRLSIFCLLFLVKYILHSIKTFH